MLVRVEKKDFPGPKKLILAPGESIAELHSNSRNVIVI
jgi:hypothetical protein